MMIGLFLSTIMASADKGEQRVVVGSVVDDKSVVGREEPLADCKAIIFLLRKIAETQGDSRKASAFTPQEGGCAVEQVYVVSVGEHEQRQQEFEQLKSEMENFFKRISNVFERRDIPISELEKIKAMIEGQLAMIPQVSQRVLAEEKSVKETCTHWEGRLRTFLRLTEARMSTEALRSELSQAGHAVSQVLKVDCKTFCGC